MPNQASSALLSAAESHRQQVQLRRIRAACLRLDVLDGGKVALERRQQRRIGAALQHLGEKAAARTQHFARDVLRPGGSFLTKVLQGGTDAALLAQLKRDYASVKHVKPQASRADSSELYLLATGFRGGRRGA